jgi:hypothetical protein
VFLTGSAFTAQQVGGLAGADALCQQAATAVGRGLPRVWRAWLSDGSVAARERIEDCSPWYIDNGSVSAPFTDVAVPTFEHLIDPALPLLRRLHRTENGLIQQTPAWTGTKLDGTAATDHCKGWTASSAGERGLTGDPTELGPAWTDIGLSACNIPLHLYCFEQ